MPREDGDAESEEGKVSNGREGEERTAEEQEHRGWAPLLSAAANRRDRQRQNGEVNRAVQRADDDRLPLGNFGSRHRRRAKQKGQ